MASPLPVWIVQDRDSQLFLCPLHGDVGYTPFIDQAGHFSTREAAIDTALDCCDPDFIVFSCYLTDPKF